LGCDVKLCRARESDLDHIERWLRHPEVRSKMMGMNEMFIPVTGRRHREMYMILNASDDRPIGYVELADMNAARGRAEIKICIGGPDDRGKGCGREALEQITSALRERGFRSIYLRVLTGNEPAVRCYERAGFIKTGILRDDRRGGGDMFLMEYLG
jgi:RimJ/RimL family protein N-acetyltransferase